MAVYAELFDGHRLEFPDGTDPSVISATAKRVTLSRTAASTADPSGAVPDELGRYDAAKQGNQPFVPTGQKEATIGSQFMGGVKQAGSDYGTFVESLGSQEAANQAAIAAAKRQEEIQREVGHVSGLKEVGQAYDKNGVLGAAGEIVSQMPGAIASSGPQMGTALAGNVAGGAAGSALFPGLGTALGAYAGGFAALFPQFYSENLATQARQAQQKGEKVDVSRVQAGVAATGQAALEEAGVVYAYGKNFLKGLFGKIPTTAAEKEIATQALVASAQSTMKSVATGMGKVALEESFVNPAQDVLERWQSGQDLFSKEAIEGYGEAVYGSLLQSPMGAGAGYQQARGSRKELEKQGLDRFGNPLPEKPPAITPPVTPPEEETKTAAPQMTAPVSESQDTQAMVDEYRGVPPAAPVATPPVEANIPAEASVTVPPPAKIEAAKEPPPEPFVVPNLATVEAPIKDLKMSKDVPQFKSGASAATGVVEPLGGKFERTGVAPIQLWERNNGDLEVISGRHRLDLAKRSGEKTIPSQIHRESEGFDVNKAASLDALLNIREGQGKVKDYVTYFQRPGYTAQEAESSGVLARSTGQRAYSIATNGSSDLIAAHRADVLTDEAATRIASTAPKEASVQALGMKLIQEGKSITNAVNMMQAVKAISGGRGEATTDMFGFDDSAMQDAEKMAKIASSKQSEISQDLSAVSGASKRPEVAKKYGVDVKDNAALQTKIEELRQQKAAWDTWSSNPDLIRQIKEQAGIADTVAPEVTEPPTTPDEDTELLFAKDKVEGNTPAEKAANVLKSYGKEAEIAYENGNISLLKTYASNGDVIYQPSADGVIFSQLKDVSSSLGDKQMDALKLTKEQKLELNEAKKKLETAETEKHKTAPFLSMKKGVSGSPLASKEMVNIARGWANMLGMKYLDIHIITKQEAIDNKDNFTGPHRPIGRVGEMTKVGAVRKLDDGSYVLVINPSTSKGKSLETIAHELGHIHEKLVFDDESKEVQAAIIKEFNAWFNTHHKISAKELIHSMRAKTVAQTTQFADPMMQASKADPYWRNFNEWYADQVSRWAVSSEKPLTVVDKFFKKLADALRKFYTTLKGQKYLPTQSMKEFLDKIAAQSQFEAIADKNNKGQMALFVDNFVDNKVQFAKEKVEPAEKPEKEKPPTEARNYLGKPVKPSWAFPEDTFIHVSGVIDVSVNDLIYKFQDKQIDTKRAQEAISKAAGQITDDINVYEKEQLFHGKVATAIREYLLNELLPAIKQLKALNLKPQEMQDYLLARHAKERNDKMNELNKLDPRTGEERTTPWELQDRASGMSTDKAQEYLKNLDPTKKANLEKVAKMFDDMITGTQKILVDSGADSQDTINAWNETYDHYVPLFRIEEDFVNGMGASGLSKGFNVSGNFSKRAMGSEKEVQDIIANLIKQRERALIRAEKLTVTKALYGLFLMNPNPDVALPVNPDAIKSKEALIKELEGLGYDNAQEIANNLMEEPKSRYISKEKVVDKDTGLPTSDTKESVKLKVDNLARFGNNVLTLRIDGKNRYIFFNQKSPDAMRMAASLKSLDVESLGTLTSMVSKATRWFASVNTQYNPIFAAVNLIRDVGGAQFNLTTTPLAGKQAQVTAGIFPAMGGIFKVLRAERKGEVGGNSDMEKAFRDFRKEGGQTGYRDSLARRDNEKSIVDEQLAKITAGGNAKKAFKAVFGALSDFNDTLENAIRLSSYLAASKPKSEGGLGLSKQQAAIIAKNLTVNFDKKGQLSANINALYAFFNASIQGTARLAQTLKGPKGKAIIGGGVLLGSMQAILLAAAGFKDDEPPEFIKERNFIIPTPGGGYLSIPYPLGLNILPSVGRLTTEFMLTGGKNPTKKVGNLIGVFADGLSPVGSAGPLQTIAPTVLDPLAALSENKDAFGRPIYKKDQATNPTPGYMRSRDSSSEISKQVSYFLNLASGGSKYSKGLLSPTADEIDYVAGQVTGGVGRELLKTSQTISAATTGEDIPAYRIPLAGRFYGETESNAAESQRFYNNVIKMADHENEIKGRIKNKEPVGPYLKDHPEARLWQSANSTENQITALNKQKKDFIERGLPKDRIKRIENQKAIIMKRFNDQLAKYED